ncbi:hypothetical protein HELRODRAFT_188988 [Helobdella robusta]|uniref:Cystatin domain-containing protein n=1 Tax=Helobdella robusta TaxID=6412 RepID=T1FQJ2_HELRO|nr:hypothetical protein HELRODRAFT_188988 [Helobdella robusta]ESN99058.1 hypothetical protein HELRODRAFT_188988 [Helobdella robusta]
MQAIVAVVVLAVCGMCVSGSGMPGGLFDMDPSSDHAKEVAEKSLQLLDDTFQGGRARVLQNIYSAQSQVVSGVKYYLKLQVGLYDCTPAELAANEKACTVEKTSFCYFQLYLQPWTQTEKLLYSFCPAF